MVRAFLTLLIFVAIGLAQSQPSQPAPDEKPVEWVCPMDRDVRAKGPGKCSRCGMDLVPGIPPFLEYPTKLRTDPKVIRPNAETTLTFEILDPKTRKRVTEFEIVHEKLFHLFLVSRDLRFFAHEHPELQPDGEFKFQWKFPSSGMYRVLSDLYPKNGTPQLTTNTIFVTGGDTPPAHLTPDLNPQKSENLTATLTMEPAQPVAGFKTLLFFDLTPGDGIEKYLGAWGHMLAASEDLVDMIHDHPFLGDGSSRIQFNMIFPRPGIYRVWVQFQRKGVVNTFAFNIPVSELK